MKDSNVIHLIELFDQNFDTRIESSNLNSIVCGGFILFITWLFFNGSSGSTIVHRAAGNIPQKTIMNTILSGSICSLTVFYLKPYLVQRDQSIKQYHIINVVNGMLAGLVSITAACNNVENYCALAIGVIGALVYIFSCKLFIYLEIDDPLEASQIHGFCGLWGVLAVGIFDIDHGALYTNSGSQFFIQLAGGASLIAWASLFSISYFKCAKHIGRLRVQPIYEIIGLDALMHEESDKFQYIPERTRDVLEFKFKT